MFGKTKDRGGDLATVASFLKEVLAYPRRNDGKPFQFADFEQQLVGKGFSLNHDGFSVSDLHRQSVQRHYYEEIEKNMNPLGVDAFKNRLDGFSDKVATLNAVSDLGEMPIQLKDLIRNPSLLILANTLKNTYNELTDDMRNPNASTSNKSNNNNFFNRLLLDAALANNGSAFDKLISQIKLNSYEFLRHPFQQMMGWLLASNIPTSKEKKFMSNWYFDNFDHIKQEIRLKQLTQLIDREVNNYLKVLKGKEQPQDSVDKAFRIKPDNSEIEYSGPEMNGLRTITHGVRG